MLSKLPVFEHGYYKYLNKKTMRLTVGELLTKIFNKSNKIAFIMVFKKDINIWRWYLNSACSKTVGLINILLKLRWLKSSL